MFQRFLPPPEPFRVAYVVDPSTGNAIHPIAIGDGHDVRFALFFRAGVYEFDTTHRYVDAADGTRVDWTVSLPKPKQDPEDETLEALIERGLRVLGHLGETPMPVGTVQFT